MLPKQTEILADANAVAARACDLISQAAQQAIAARGVFRLVLSGGTTPNLIYQRLAVTNQAWQQWEIFWGDERCLPLEDNERNAKVAYQLWLSKVPIPDANIYVIPAELGAERGANDYAQAIHSQLPFDVVLLGMGEDGHTASLFPGQPIPSGLTMPVHHSPKPPADRVSLTREALQATQQQLIVVTGTGKQQALMAWRQGQDLPIANVSLPSAYLLVDQPLADACGGLLP